MLRRRIVTYTILLTGVLLGIIGALPAPAAAQASAGSDDFTTSPTILNLSIAPGQTKSTTLQLLNGGVQPQNITVQLESFSPLGETGSAAIAPLAASNPESSYVHFSKSSFLAQPGVWNSITMTISLPKTAQLGYYYAVVFKPAAPNLTGKDTNIVTSADAILVLIDTHSSNEVHKVQLVSFTSLHKIYDFLPATFNVTLKNVGNIYLPPVGDIYISKDPTFKHVIDVIGVNTTLGKILPSSDRTFTVQWTDGFPLYTPVNDGNAIVHDPTGQVVTSLKWNFSQTSKFRFGKYYARLDVVYNNGIHDVPLQSSLSFWVIPWKYLIVAIVILIVFILGIYLIFRSVFKGGRRLFSTKSGSSSYRYRR